MSTLQPLWDPFVLVLGSRNRKKCQEMAELIAPSWEQPSWANRLEIRSLGDFPDAPEVVEDAASFAGNARKKASELAMALGQWVLADDSGLTVDALNGAPGVMSARMLASHATMRPTIASCCRKWPTCRTTAVAPPSCAALAIADPSGADPARGRRSLPRQAHSPPARSRRFRL